MGNFYEHPDNKYLKHDFLVSLKNLHGIFSAENYEKKGIEIDLLSNKKIYPSFSVWTPTS